jgi:RNA polymerase sigma factor (sigma-70 family)
MPEEAPFHDLIRRVRAGERQAATDLVRRYEPAVRRAVRVWLVDARLRRAFDSADICQSVLGSFFVRVALGQYQLDRPEQLVNLLLAMARNKLADQKRRQQAECRDSRREASANPEKLIAGDASPSQQVAGEELLREFRRRLSAEERHLAEQRACGREWSAIAAERGGASPEALRKQLARAINRVARELGMDEMGDD